MSQVINVVCDVRYYGESDICIEEEPMVPVMPDSNKHVIQEQVSIYM